MKMFRLSANILTLIVAGILAGCSGTSASPDVAASIRKSLDEAGFKNVTVSQDREKGIVTLGGKAEIHDTFFPVLAHGNVFETRFIKRFANAGGDIG